MSAQVHAVPAPDDNGDNEPMARTEIVLPAGYASTFDALKARVTAARLNARRTVNTQLIELYWHIGDQIRIQQDRQGWGTGVIRRLAEDLRAAFPDMTGLSYRNLQYMRSFAASWTDGPIVQQAAAQLPWGHIMVLIDKLDTNDARTWYASAAVEHGWSRNVLMNMIMNQTLERTGAAPSNFTKQLASPDSELRSRPPRTPTHSSSLDSPPRWQNAIWNRR